MSKRGHAPNSTDSLHSTKQPDIKNVIDSDLANKTFSEMRVYTNGFICFCKEDKENRNAITRTSKKELKESEN